MWVFTTDGFYSAVQHRDDQGLLMVRCRVRDDAQRLAHWLADHGTQTEVQETPDADYGWRLTVPHAVFGQYLAAAATAVDYPNFKNAVAARQGLGRAVIYGQVWSELLTLQVMDRSD